MRFLSSRVRTVSAGLRRCRTLLFGLGLSILGIPLQAATLTAIHDYWHLVSGLDSPKNLYPSLSHEFEGLTFTADGSLWAAIAPNPLDAKREFWRLDLSTNSIAESIADSFHAPSLPLLLPPLVNPVALTANAGQLIVGENYRALRERHLPLLTSNDMIWAFTPGSSTPAKPDWSVPLAPAACDGVQGAAFAAGKVYISCGANQSIVEIDAAKHTLTGKHFDFAFEPLGLEAIDDTHLIVGDYANHQLRVFDLENKKLTETIDLNSLFVGEDSDYFGLTGQKYSVQVVPSEDLPRDIPDPDGLAYRDGKIYMAFDGDLRIFVISMSLPEPGTLLLVAAALAALAWRGRSTAVQSRHHFTHV